MEQRLSGFEEDSACFGGLMVIRTVYRLSSILGIYVSVGCFEKDNEYWLVNERLRQYN